MDNNNTNNNNNKPNNKVNMPKFNLNWLYMIIALMLLGLWWSSDSRGSCLLYTSDAADEL